MTGTVLMLLEILDPDLIFCLLVALAASAMTAYAGFGGALVMVPLLTFLLGPVQAVALTGLCSFVGLVHVCLLYTSDAADE